MAVTGTYLSSSSDLSNLIRMVNKTRPKIELEVQNAVWNQFNYLNTLKAMGGVRQGLTGARFNWPVEMAKNDTVGARSYTDEIPQVMQDRHRFAEESWCEYTGSFVISQRDVDANSGGEKLIDYFMSELDGLRTSLQDKINADLLTGSGTLPACDGLTVVIPESAGTVHGIHQSTDTWWANQTTASSCSKTNAFGPIVMKEILSQSMLAGRGQGKNPFRLGVTDDATYANMAYYAPGTNIKNLQGFYTVTNQGGPSSTLKSVKESEPTFDLMGARIIFDHAAVADAIRFFDPGKSVEVLVMKNNFFRMSQKVESENTFAYTVKMGVILMQVNKNPFTTGVIYNFNS